MVTLVFSLGLLNFSVLAAISLLHLYWAFGGTAGLHKSLPTNTDGKTMLHPGKAACFVVALALAAFAVIFLPKLELVQVWFPDWVRHYGVVIVSVTFLARAFGDFRYVGFTKRIRTTTFAKLDTRYYSPLCLLLGLNGIVIEVLLRRFVQL